MRIIYAYIKERWNREIVNERTRREAIRKGRNACCVVLLWWYANAQTGEFLCSIMKYLFHSNEFFFFETSNARRSTQFIDGKLELQGQRTKSRSEREVELENEYNKMIDEFKDFDYELKPIPKPGDGKTN